MSRGSQGSVAFSLLLGAILVPVTAVAAVLIVEPRVSATSAQAAPASADTPTMQQDLTEACGPSGLELVGAEEADTATPLQQAALDALRPVCESVGMPLPAQPVQPVVVPEETPPAPEVVTVGAPQVDDDDGEYEYEYDDGEWEIDD
jgi:hypothetical protein